VKERGKVPYLPFFLFFLPRSDYQGDLFSFLLRPCPPLDDSFKPLPFLSPFFTTFFPPDNLTSDINPIRSNPSPRDRFPGLIQIPSNHPEEVFSVPPRQQRTQALSKFRTAYTSHNKVLLFLLICVLLVPHFLLPKTCRADDFFFYLQGFSEKPVQWF